MTWFGPLSNPTWQQWQKLADDLNAMYGAGRFVLFTSQGIRDTKDGKTYGVLTLPALKNKLANEPKAKKHSTAASNKVRIKHDDIDVWVDDYLEHYGVLGMKWGVRKDPERAYKKASGKLEKLDRKAVKAGAKASRKETRSLRRQQRADTAWLFPKTKARLADWAIGRSEKARQKYVKKMSRAVSWYKEMENAFRDTKVSSFDPSTSELGKKYANVQINDMMGNATTSLANKQLRMIYRQMGR